MNLKDVSKEVHQCQKCELYETKKNYVFGSGDEKATIMFIGEAPGANEDEQGVPFVGKAGNVLKEMLGSIDLQREDVYICNVLKCRPPNNRNPQVDEIEACKRYLDAQIDIVKPNIICPLGNFATQFVFKKFNLKDELKGISKMHGLVFKVSTLTGTIKIIPMYHPAVATYGAEMKDALINDMQKLKDANK